MQHDQAQSDKPPFLLRSMTKDDAAYVLDSWVNSYRRSAAAQGVLPAIFNIEQRARIHRLVTRPLSRVVVAACPLVTRTIRGWICFEPAKPIPIVHYVCVQPNQQLKGVGTALINVAKMHLGPPAEGKDGQEGQYMWSTHETHPMRYVRDKWNLLYNPYLLELLESRSSVRQKDLVTDG